MAKPENAERQYIWISRWEDFQHYAPERDRPPAWIKTYTKQLSDDRYLDLSLAQRGLLHDLRTEFARSQYELTTNTTRLCYRLGYKVYTKQLEALNHAGFIDFVSREVLDQRLEQVYASRAPARSSDVEEDLEEEVEKEKTSGAQSPADVQSVYDHWRQARGKTRSNYDRISPGRRKKIQSRLREFTAAELKNAIDNVAKDPWPDRALHDDLTVIFRSRETVERFLEMKAATNGTRPMTVAEKAKAWVLATGWRLPDEDMLDELGRMGIEGPEKTALAELAYAQQANHS